MSDESESVDTRIEQLFAAIHDLTDKGCYASVCRLYGEVRRLSRAEGRIIPYLLSSFHLADKSSNILQPVQARELIVELISLVESEDRARQIQPSFPEAEYAGHVHWMSTCVYDKLADTTAMVEGYNSPGMHESLQEGIQVCRRAGKLECIKCFREYAVDVYRAADDLEMSLHNARVVASGQGPETVRGDRRWIGTYKESRITLLMGQLEAAEGVSRKGIELAESYHTHVTSRSLSSLDLEVLLHLAGRSSELTVTSPGDRVCTLFPTEQIPIVGEFPDLDLEFALRDAVIAGCRNDFKQAIEILTPFDRLLQERKYVDRWLEVRTRLVAAAALAGDTRKAVALAKGLEARAQESQDWLTLKRLRAIRERPFPLSPLALPYPLTSGPFSASPQDRTFPAASVGSSGRTNDREASRERERPEERLEDSDLATRDPLAPPGVPPAPQQSAPRGDADQPPSPLLAWLIDLQEQWRDAEDPDEDKYLGAILARSPEEFTTPREASAALRLLEMLSADPSRVLPTWAWAERLAAKFPGQASVLNTLAALASSLCTIEDSPLREKVTQDQVAEWMTRSLKLDFDDWGNFARAGEFFLQTGNVAEAERCFARASRLNRAHPYLALRLANVYSHTDRPRDALLVLDTCLREGTVVPPLLMEAALLCQRLERPESMITYLDKHEEIQPGEPWIHYFRALGLLDSGHPEEARAALELERQRSTETGLHLTILDACIARALGDEVKCREQTAAALAVPLRTVDYLTQEGLAKLFGKLWRSISEVAHEDVNSALLTRLEERLLQIGMMPDDALERHRTRQEKQPDLTYFVCRLRQPLDRSWAESPGCLSGQEHWTGYVTNWGVLARNELAAVETVLAWQSRCAPLPAEMLDCHPQPGTYEDSPGVVWQGPHFPEDAPEPDE